MKPMLIAVMAAGGVCGCTSPPPHSKGTGTELRIASARAGPFYTELASAYQQAMPDIRARIVTDGDPVDAVEDGRADVTVMMADSAYFRYWKSPGARSSTRTLRAVATLEHIPLHLVVRPGTGIRTLADLPGRSIATEVPGGIVGLVLEAFGLSSRVHVQRLVLVDSIALMERGALDAVLSVMYYPDPRIEEMMAKYGGQLLSIEGVPIERLRQTYPFLRLAQIPSGAYTGQPIPIHTIGTTLLYVCRSDLPEDFVYQITKGLFDALPTASARLQSMRVVNVQHAAAVPIPLHDGAARYYQEMELR
jgi:TRAP transporter TAXI family solute receptor